MSQRCRGFTTLALLSGGALLFSSTAGALLLLKETAEAEVAQYARRPRGAFTQLPTKPYLGARPGRDPQGRGGVWNPERRAEVEGRLETRRLFAGQGAPPAPTHTVAVAADAGPSYPWEGSAGGVNTGNGNKLTTLNLLSWKVRGGMTLDFTLYHNSQTNYQDELGHGWTWTYDVYVNNLGSNPILHWGDGTSIPFTLAGSTYTPPAGIHDALVKNADNTWTVTKKDGTKWSLNAAGFLTKVQDRNGNAIVLTLNAGNYVTKITDPTGRYVNVSVSSGKFSSITDHAGRQTGVDYPAGTDTGFGYDNADRRTSMVDRPAPRTGATTTRTGSRPSPRLKARRRAPTTTWAAAPR